MSSRALGTGLGVAWLCALLLLAACTEDSTPRAASFEHYDALARGLARSSAALEAGATATPSAAEVEAEHISGLVHMLANSRGRMRDLPLEDIKQLGDSALPELVLIAVNSEQDAAERVAAVELMATLASPMAAEHLMQLCEQAPESWMRAQAAWRLSQVDADWLVPRLMLRLKYEADHEAVLWLASTLAKYKNFDGLSVLWRFRNEGANEELRASAQERLETIASEAGLQSADENWQLWNVADPERKIFNASPSARLRHEVWKWIEQLSGEHFQLRGVDDARFVLSRMGAWVTEPLCEALHDNDVYVRVHAAQCLERMGPRATDAGPALLEALADPSLAGQAAAALGRVAYPSAEPALRALLNDSAADHELRVACAAALGEMAVSASVLPLAAIMDSQSEPQDLRQVAANALVRLGAGDRAAGFLLAALDDPDADQPGAEEQLALWLRAREDAASLALRVEWDSHDLPPGIIPTTAQAAARRVARKQLLHAAWADLPGVR